VRKLFFAVSVAFLFFSCDNGGMENEKGNPNPFVGTWEADHADPDFPVKMIFTENEVTGYDKNGGVFSSDFTGDMPWAGSYIYKPTYANDPYKSGGNLEIHCTSNSFFEIWCILKTNSLYFTDGVELKKVNN
jgi:hypothetical protein